MALIVKDRVKETTTSTGTGTITLAGSPTGFRTFSDIGNGNTTYYCISGGSQFEVGIGTYTASGTTLSRDTVLSNSLGTTALINFSAGTKDVFVTYPSDKAILGTTSAVSSTGTGSVVLSGSPTLSGNIGLGVTPIDWGSQNNSIQVGRGGAISNVIGSGASTCEMSISSNLKFNAGFYKYVNNGLASRYYQLNDTHYWSFDTGSGVANTFANLTNVMTLDNTGNLTIIGTLTGQNASVENLYSLTGNLQVNTGGAGNTTIGSSGAGYTTNFNDDTNNFYNQVFLQSGAIFNGTAVINGTLDCAGTLDLTGSSTVNQNIATNQTTGSLTIGGSSATGSITLGQSTGAQAINIGNGAASTSTINIGGTGASTGTITIGRSTGSQSINIGATATGGAITIGNSIARTGVIQIGSGSQSTSSITIGSSTFGNTVNIASGSLLSGNTKALNLGTNGASGSTTNIAIGSTTGTSTTTVNGLLKQQTYTVATLPTGTVSSRSFVTDALAPTFGATVAGGGAVGVPVYHDGTSWKVG